MAISFDKIPANLKLSLYWVEVDGSLAGLPTNRKPALLIGQKFASGSAPNDQPIAVGTQQQARDFFGEGSMLERMFQAFYNNSFAHEVWALPVAEPGAGVAASGSISVTSAPTDAGVLTLYIAGQKIEIGVGATDTAVDVCADIVATINANTKLPVTATAATDGTVASLTCRWKGATGNDIDIRHNYLGALNNEILPKGLGLSITAMANGAGVPSFTNAIAGVGGNEYLYAGLPFTDAASLSAWETEYGFSDSGRWGWARQQFGSIFSAYRGTFSGIVAFGQTRNSPVTSILDVEVDVPSPVWEVTAAYVSKAARALTNDPARPLQTLVLEGILPARRHNRFIPSELNVLASNGIAIQQVNADGQMAIAREVTTYQKNSSGYGDDAYELVTTLHTLSTVLINQRHAITSKYPRHKLADNGTRVGVGQKVVTPNVIKAELIAQYAADMLNGLVENLTAFKTNLLVERDPNNPNRVNVVYPPDLVNQLRVFAVLAQFRLQYDRGIDTAILR